MSDDEYSSEDKKIAQLYQDASDYSEQGDYERAIDSYKQIIRIYPDDLEAHWCLGHTLLENNEIGRAIDIFIQGILRDRENEQNFHGELGICYQKIKKYSEAAEEFKKALHAEPDIEVLYSLLAECYIEMEEYDKAIRLCKKGIEYIGEDGSLYGYVGYSYLMMKLKKDLKDGINISKTEIKLIESLKK